MLDGELAKRDYLVGTYGIADIMTWPWIKAAVEKLGLSLDAHPNLRRWYDTIAACPAVQRGLSRCRC